MENLVIMKCIYCGETNKNKFNTKEHVIMRCFGTFGSETPTLDCVCDNCNSFFNTELDQPFARNSLEGITRYRKDIYSREKRFQDKNYLLITLPKENDFGEWQGVVVSIDGTKNGGILLVPQVHFKNKKNEYEPVLDFELDNLDWKAKNYSTKDMKIFATSEKNHQNLIKKLKSKGINYKIKTTFKPDFIDKYKDKKILIHIEGLIDHRIKRAISKILFNFSAKFLGYEEIIKKEWNKTRRYVRYDDNPIKARATSKPFWGEETNELRYFDNSYNVRVENINNSVVGVIQLFNLYLYEFILVKNYTIPKSKEICYRFTPGEEPIKGKKYEAIEVNGKRIPIIR